MKRLLPWIGMFAIGWVVIGLALCSLTATDLGPYTRLDGLVLECCGIVLAIEALFAWRRRLREDRDRDFNAVGGTVFGALIAATLATAGALFEPVIHDGMPSAFPALGACLILGYAWLRRTGPTV